MEKKIQKEFIDEGFGFPVNLRNIPMIKVRGEWTPNINYNQLSIALLHALSFKPTRLTGAEIHFVRTYFEMTLKEFAKRFCVSHVAVLKWEKTKLKSTSMAWSTEKDIRLFILSRLKGKAILFSKLYSELETMPQEKAKPIDLNYEELAA